MSNKHKSSREPQGRNVFGRLGESRDRSYSNDRKHEDQRYNKEYNEKSSRKRESSSISRDHRHEERYIDNDRNKQYYEDVPKPKHKSDVKHTSNKKTTKSDPNYLIMKKVDKGRQKIENLIIERKLSKSPKKSKHRSPSYSSIESSKKKTYKSDSAHSMQEYTKKAPQKDLQHTEKEKIKKERGRSKERKRKRVSPEPKKWKSPKNEEKSSSLNRSVHISKKKHSELLKENKKFEKYEQKYQEEQRSPVKKKSKQAKVKSKIEDDYEMEINTKPKYAKKSKPSNDRLKVKEEEYYDSDEEYQREEERRQVEKHKKKPSVGQKQLKTEQKRTTKKKAVELYMDNDYSEEEIKTKSKKAKPKKQPVSEKHSKSLHKPLRFTESSESQSQPSDVYSQTGTGSDYDAGERKSKVKVKKKKHKQLHVEEDVKFTDEDSKYEYEEKYIKVKKKQKKTVRNESLESNRSIKTQPESELSEFENDRKRYLPQPGENSEDDRYYSKKSHVKTEQIEKPKHRQHSYDKHRAEVRVVKSAINYSNSSSKNRTLGSNAEEASRRSEQKEDYHSPNQSYKDNNTESNSQTKHKRSYNEQFDRGQERIRQERDVKYNREMEWRHEDSRKIQKHSQRENEAMYEQSLQIKREQRNHEHYPSDNRKFRSPHGEENRNIRKQELEYDEQYRRRQRIERIENEHHFKDHQSIERRDRQQSLEYTERGRERERSRKNFQSPHQEEVYHKQEQFESRDPNYRYDKGYAHKIPHPRDDRFEKIPKSEYYKNEHQSNRMEYNVNRRQPPPPPPPGYHGRRIDEGRRGGNREIATHIKSHNRESYLPPPLPLPLPGEYRRHQQGQRFDGKQRNEDRHVYNDHRSHLEHNKKFFTNNKIPSRGEVMQYGRSHDNVEMQPHNMHKRYSREKNHPTDYSNRSRQNFSSEPEYKYQEKVKRRNSREYQKRTSESSEKLDLEKHSNDSHSRHHTPSQRRSTESKSSYRRSHNSKSPYRSASRKRCTASPGEDLRLRKKPRHEGRKYSRGKSQEKRLGLDKEKISLKTVEDSSKTTENKDDLGDDPLGVDWISTVPEKGQKRSEIPSIGSVLNRFTPENILRTTGVVTSLLPPHLLQKVTGILSNQGNGRDVIMPQLKSSNNVVEDYVKTPNAFTDCQLRRKLNGVSNACRHKLVPPLIINAKTYDISVKHYSNRMELPRED